MIHCAEKLLKDICTEIGAYASSHRGAAFWRDIGTLEKLSLQELSLKSDEAFFGEINSVLNVITTILIHPHIVNERGSIIIRAEQAHGLTPEMFLDTVHDQRLWKDKRGEMTPADVYYFQNLDSLVNYENRFIVHLINEIGAQLSEYAKFYDYLLGNLARDGALTPDGSELEGLALRLETLAKKVRRIKGTYFYREVIKSGAALTHVETTNVLKHNRLYNRCFRFYTRYVIYDAEQARSEDLRAYFFTRLLLALKGAGYRLRSHGKGEGAVRPMSFESDEFVLEVQEENTFGGLQVNITNRENAELHTENVLLFDGSADFSTVRRDILSYPRTATSIEAVNLWDIAYVGGEVLPQNGPKASETGLLARYLAGKTRTVQASRNLYTARCPVCGGREVFPHENFLSCGRCGSLWCFVGDRAWIAKSRKQ